MYTIYEHVSPSGKRYIGQTCQKLSRRWRNGTGYARNEYFYRAIKKYGWDNFQHNIICQCATLDEANNSDKAKKAIERLNQSKAKKVRCIETGVVYSSTHEVERQTGFRQSNVSAACRGDHVHAYGFRWEYV